MRIDPHGRDNDHSAGVAPPACDGSLWTARHVTIVAVFFLMFFNIALLYLYPLAVGAMGGGHDAVGLVMGVFSVAAVVSRPFLGALIGTTGEPPIVSLGLVVMVGASLAYSLVTAFGPAMLLIRFVHGIGFSACIAGGFSLAARVFPSRKRAQAFGALGAAIMGAVALAPPLGELLIDTWGFTPLYLASAAAATAAWFLCTFTSVLRVPGRHRAPFAPMRYRALLADRSFVFLLLSTLIFAHCQSTVVNFAALLAQEAGAHSGRYFFVSFTVAILALLTLGKSIDRLGNIPFMTGTYPLLTVGILLAPFMIASGLFWVPALLFGVGIGVLFATHNAAAADRGTVDEKPAVMALFTTVYDSGFMTGALVSGLIAHLTSLGTLFVTSGILAAMGLLVIVAERGGGGGRWEEGKSD